MSVWGFLFLCFVLVVTIKRFRVRQRPKRANLPRRSRVSRVAIGNALQNLQEFFQPQVRYQIREQLVEQEENEDEGQPVSSEQHLLRQARRLQRGEIVDGITALWSPPDADS